MSVFKAVLESDTFSEFWGGFGIDRRKVCQYLGLFCLLAIIYSICLSMFLKVVTASPDRAQLEALMRQIGKLCLVASLPFAVLAYSDKSWRSSDAAPVSAGAWIAVCAGFSSKYTICPFAVALPFFGFTFCALLAHMAGALCRLAKQGELNFLSRP